MKPRKQQPLREQPKAPPRSIRLPREEERSLQEELNASGRAPSNIITEALRIRRAVLEALGIEAVGTDAGLIFSLVKDTLLAGMEARARARRLK